MRENQKRLTNQEVENILAEMRAREKEPIAEKIYQTLSGSAFEDWYNTGEFDRHITGEIPTPNKAEILAQIVKLFHL